ncbi:uncharacterized protein N7484_009327 [Penicillium longicatenatum]|uniref:uncharacterized protein n=1 Tax=Penicillium longicatenatum TaxID=1561947 RepID=UPI0025478525|nr:uncharacterized protein N7484_009327 [Penicillium longicatenatum]KAJ5636014.1 hypothetical protein N7484_009327 [Penicillium longicatenatum]
MPRSDPSSCFSGFKSGLEIVKPPRKERTQQLACDRCRGQKLRCIRTPNPNAPCERCQKAGATCIIDSSVRMGRPRRTDNEQRETTGSSHNPPQPTRSPALPATSSQAPSSAGFTPNADAWSGHDFDETVDPLLRGITVQYMESFDFSLSGDPTLGEQNTLDISPENYLNPTMDLSLDQTILGLPKDEGAVTDSAATTVNDHGLFRPICQETIKELSDLNVQLYRQLGVVRPMASKYTNIHPGLSSTALATAADENHTISDAVIFMMHGLQTYHRLLVEILGSRTGPTHSATYESHDNSKSSTVATSLLLSPAEGIESEGPKGRRTSETAGGPPRKRVRSESSSAKLAMLHGTDSPHSAILDMPSSLLLLSCHTNLMHLSRDAFAAIRTALLATHHRITLFTISIFHIDEVSLPPDPDLQIIVLTQAVLRLIDKIGRLLGYPNDCEGDSGGERCETKARGRAIPPQLVDLVLGREADGEGLADRVGIEALREEIRSLHEIVYQEA